MDELRDLVERVTLVERRALVRAFLKREEAGRQIAEMGLSQDELDARVTVLTDQEVLEIAEGIDRIPDHGAIDKASGARLESARDVAIVVLLFLILLSI